MEWVVRMVGADVECRAQIVRRVASKGIISSHVVEESFGSPPSIVPMVIFLKDHEFWFLDVLGCSTRKSRSGPHAPFGLCSSRTIR